MRIGQPGVKPPMTTPFRKDGEIDFKQVAPEVDWLIGAGSHGMAAGGSTGEGHTPDHEGNRDLGGAAGEAARGPGPGCAGSIVESPPGPKPGGEAFVARTIAAPPGR